MHTNSTTAECPICEDEKKEQKTIFKVTKSLNELKKEYNFELQPAQNVIVFTYKRGGDLNWVFATEINGMNPNENYYEIQCGTNPEKRYTWKLEKEVFGLVTDEYYGPYNNNTRCLLEFSELTNVCCDKKNQKKTKIGRVLFINYLINYKENGRSGGLFFFFKKEDDIGKNSMFFVTQSEFIQLEQV